jgi:hypothetical protein
LFIDFRENALPVSLLLLASLDGAPAVVLAFAGVTAADVANDCVCKFFPTFTYSSIDPVPLKGLSHEINFKNFDKNLQNLA